MVDADGMRCDLIRDESGRVVASARVSPDITDEGRKALAALIVAVKRDMEVQEAADPSRAEKQAAAVARIRERVRRLRGDAQ